MGCVRFAVAVLTGLLASSAPAVASTVSVDAGRLVFSDEEGVLDEFDVFPSGAPGVLQVHDYAGSAQPGSGCALTPDPFALLVISCAGVSEGVTLRTGGGGDFAFVFTEGLGLDAQMGDGDDFVVAETGTEDVIDGGPGSDLLMGGPGADRISGGDGDDLLSGDFTSFAPPEGGDGADFLARIARYRQAEGGSADADADILDGGAGSDVLDGGAGPDVLNGGEDSDLVTYASRSAGVTVTLDGAPGDGEPGENDHIGADVESVVTGEGDDNVTGNARPQTIVSGAGDDLVDLGAGEDFTDTGPGDDRVTSRDNRMDFVSCGSGRDSLKADGKDQFDECEKVDRPKGSVAGGAAGGLALKAIVRDRRAHV